MDDLLARLEQRIGLTRADVLGLAVALLGCVAATVVALGVQLPDPAPSPPAAGTDELAPAAPVGAAVLVHVAGAVHRPGVVELVAGDRVADALDAAGGLLPTASVAALNLARPLVDGEQVLVPTVDEVAEGTGAVPAAADDPTLPDGRLDLNRATATDLEELPGVGPVLAARIVAHRTEQGPFTAAADLRAVSGIGEATWAALRDLVGVR